MMRVCVHVYAWVFACACFEEWVYFWIGGGGGGGGGEDINKSKTYVRIQITGVVHFVCSVPF